jgi:serine/threonine protein kinase
MSTIPAIPGYRLHRQLGVGGMGVVYHATRDDNSYQYAIKMLLGGRDAAVQELARFRIEAEAYACLNHPNIVKIRDVGVVAGCPFLAMDYAEHGSLGDYLKQSPSISIDWRVRTIKQVAEALTHAHSRRILHRDLKPANILIGSGETPKVTDFGLVKFAAPIADVSASCCTFQVSDLDAFLVRMTHEQREFLPADTGEETILQTVARECADRWDLPTASFDLAAVRTFMKQSVETRRSSEALTPALDELTRQGSVMGSPRFMAPEQAEGRIEAVDRRTDVYGLGATLYHTVTGRPPVEGGNLWETIRNVSLETPLDPTRLNPAVSNDLSLVILKSLEKAPDRRYPNMEMFAEDLDHILEGRPPLARLNSRRSR